MSAPAELGPFQILELLGEGGSGVVYAARGPDGHEVALKVLREELGLEPRELTRFVEEAGRMRRVSHPGIVPVLDVGMLPDGRPYLVMPRLRGRALSERLSGAGPFSLEHAMRLFAGVAAALGALHEAGLVHRDVKPENVLFLEQEDRLVLLDLGIARDADAIASTTTRAGLMRGTPAYMAPERIFGRSATIRSDVYELALLFYMMVVGKLPWDGEDPRGRMSPKHPVERGVSVPGPVVNVLFAALDVDFDRRPASVADLLAQLEAALARSQHESSETVRAGFAPRTPAIVVTPPAHDHATDPSIAQAPTVVSPPRAFPPAPAPGTTLRSGGSGATPHVVVSASAPPPPQPRPSGSPVGLLAAGAIIAIGGAIAGAFAVGYLRSDRSADGRPQVTVSDVETIPTADESVRPAPSVPPSAEPSTPPSATPSAEPDAPVAQPTGSPSAKPVASTPSPSATTTSTAGAPGVMPASCRNLINLMCDPTSGARPEECTAWKSNVASWQQKLPPNVTAETCQSAFDTSQKGLAMRRESKKP